MKIGKNFVKLRCVELRQKVCKIAERNRALVKIFGFFHDLIGDRVGYKFINAEISFARFVVDICRAVLCIDQRKAFPIGIPAAFHNFFAAEFRNEADVVHQLVHVFK